MVGGKNSKKNMKWKDCIELTYNQLNRKGTYPHRAGFLKWMFLSKKIGYQFDYLMYGMLYLIYRENLAKKNDYVVAIVGKEGIGKTYFGSKICSVIDPEGFNIKKMCFTEEEVLSNFKNNKERNAMQIDEGGFTLFSREAMLPIHRDMIKLFMAIRKKCFFIVICCPSYRSLDTYIREHRVAMLIDVRKRGYYQAYVDIALTKVNQDLLKKQRISQIKVEMKYSWQGQFNDGLPPTITTEEYEEKKDMHINNFIEAVSDKVKTGEDFEMIPTSQVAEKLSLKPKTIVSFINKGLIKGKKIGRNWFIDKKTYNSIISKGIPSE